MVRHATFLIVLAVLAAGCGGAQKGESPEPPISMDAADKLVPGQAARSVALQTEIRSAGHDCSKVVRTLKQGVREGALPGAPPDVPRLVVGSAAMETPNSGAISAAFSRSSLRGEPPHPMRGRPPPRTSRPCKSGRGATASAPHNTARDKNKPKRP